MYRKNGLLVLFIILTLSITPFAGVFNMPDAVVDAQSDDTLTLAGLEGPVTVIYDQMGIPHIYADSVHDLFMAQGYVEATHRFWQMDWWRRISSGRLSEIAGDATFGNDVLFRTLGFQAAAERDLEIASDEALAALDAYTAGVNAYLEGKEPADAAVEYGFLAQAGISLDDIAPWEPVDTVRWYKVMALSLSGNFQDEIFRAEITSVATQFGADLLIPLYPFDQHPVIVEPGGVELAGVPTESTYEIPDNVDYSKVAFDLVGGVNMDDPYVTPFGNGSGIGSNSWVIGGDMTDSGLPYLANDPHLGIQMPSIWYEVGLHCNEVSDACPYNVVGISFAGSPGVVIGHNDNIAWGFTNVGSDVQDLYILTVNPDNPAQYMLDDEWVDFEIVTETINLAGGEPFELNVRNSVWGPVISEAIDQTAQILALRWTALDGNTTVDALLAMNRASNWDEFRVAGSLFDVPAQNLLYADVEGNIGYQMPGKTPLRAEGHTGRVPVDGSTLANEWQGYVDYDELPRIFNPESGYIVTANNSVVGPDYPYYITDDWDYGYRATRIEQMIQSDEDGVFSIEDMQAIHGDNYNLKADYLIPALQNLTFEDEALAEMVEWLAAWDRQNDADSGEALLFEMYWVELMTNAFADDLGFVPSGGSHYWYVMDNMIADPTNFIYGTVWDDSTTDDRETADVILANSFADAVAAVSAEYGDDPMTWRWGDAHVAHFLAAPLGQGVDPAFDALLNSLFNVHVGVSGGNSIVNATGWSAGNPFNVGGLPSMRQILIPGDWDSSLRINTVGQSGDPLSRHYEDQVEMWVNIEYHPDWFSRDAVEADAEATWQLTP